MLIYSSILVLFLFLFIRYWRKFEIPGINPWLISSGLLIKILAGGIFLYIYSEHYGNGKLTDDAFVYMSESKILHDVSYHSTSDYFKLLFELGDEPALTAKYLNETKHWDAGEQALLNDAKNLLKVHSIIHFISFGTPFIHVLIMCFIGLLGTIFLTKALLKYTNLPPPYLFLLFLLFPGLLFWSSGLAKEPFVILGIGLILYGILNSFSVRKRTVLLIIGTMLLLMFKSYLLVVAIPSVLFFILHKTSRINRIWFALLITILILVILPMILTSTRDQAVHLLTRKQFDFNNIARGGLHVDAGNVFYYFQEEDLINVQIENDSVRVIHETRAMILQHGQMSDPVPIQLFPSDHKWPIYFQNKPANGMIEITPIKNSSTQLIKNIPEALVNVFFRPFPWDPGSKMKYLALIELVLFYSMFLILPFASKRLDEKGKLFLVSLTFFAVTLALLIGWTTPVLGAIARYRIPIMIVGICIFALKIDYNKIRIRWKNMR